jgi:hypothetical protein
MTLMKDHYNLNTSAIWYSFFLTENHALKAYWESGGIAPRILDVALDGG